MSYYYVNIVPVTIFIENIDQKKFVSDLYIPRIGLPIWLQQNSADRSRLYINRIAHRYMNWEIGRQNIIILIWI
jgi:hypothetical protein